MYWNTLLYILELFTVRSSKRVVRNTNGSSCFRFLHVRQLLFLYDLPQEVQEQKRRGETHAIRVQHAAAVQMPHLPQAVQAEGEPEGALGRRAQD